MGYIGSVSETHDRPHRINRLLRLILELQSRPEQRPRQLAARLGVSRTAIFEDLKMLAEAGLAWQFDRRRGRYVRQHDETSPVLDLTLQETLALVLAVRQFSSSGDHILLFDAVEAIRKLIAAAPEKTRAILQGALDDVLRETFRAEPGVVGRLLDAMKRKAPVQVLYDNDPDSRPEWIRLNPYQIFFQARALYLDALPAGGSEVLTYRVSRMRRIERYEGRFDVRDGYDFVERHRHTFRAIRGDGVPKHVRIRFHGKAARYIAEARWHASQRIQSGENGDVVLHLDVSHPLEVLWYLVLPWAEYAEVIEPDWLAREFRRISSLLSNRLNGCR